jgi:hypothetical protein
MDVDELANRRLQFADAAEGAAPNPLVGKLGEPSLNEVQPRAIGLGEVNVESRALDQPVPDDRRFVSA